MEAMEMEILKILTLGRCKIRFNVDRPANYHLYCNYSQRREWKFAQIRGYI